MLQVSFGMTVLYTLCRRTSTVHLYIVIKLTHTVVSIRVLSCGARFLQIKRKYIQHDAMSEVQTLT